MHRLAQMICDKYHKAVVFLTRDYDNAHIVIAKHEQSNFDVKHVFDHFVSEYHIKGSCKGNTAQGGGLYREEMETYMKTFDPVRCLQDFLNHEEILKIDKRIVFKGNLWYTYNRFMEVNS